MSICRIKILPSVTFFRPFAAALGASLGASLGCLALGAEYTIIDLGICTPADINNHGLAVVNTPDGAFLHDGTNQTALTVLALQWPVNPEGPPPTSYRVTVANAINDGGQVGGYVRLFGVVGYSLLSDGHGNGYLLNGAGVLAVNTAGQAAIGPSGSFFFTGTNVIPAVGPSPSVVALNDSGIGAGAVSPGGSIPQAAIFSLETGASTTLDLSSIANRYFNQDPRQSAYQSQATAINNAGQVVGTLRSFYQGYPSPAFLHSGGVATELGTLGGSIATPHDINNSGIIVGESTLSDASSRAFIYRNGAMTDLNTLTANSGWVLTSANALNDLVQIVGTGTLNGEVHGFLLNPIQSGSTQPPSIVTQPVGGQFALGASTSLKVTETGTAPFTYAWSKDGKPLSNATSDTLSLPSLRGTDSGIYRVVITNSAGSATSADVTLTILDPLLAAAKYTVVQLTGEAGGRYLIEYVNRAGDTQWQPLSTLTLTNSTQLYLDVESVTNAFRIYRSTRQP